MTVDVLYLARNRLEFTQTTFRLLLANTDWAHVDRLVVYDDGSTDGTRAWLDGAVAADAPDGTVYRRTNFRSPVAVMLHYLDHHPADVFAKVDNDIALPPGWLTPALDVMRRSTSLDLLGLAAGWTGVPAHDGIEAHEYGWKACSHIGGVGMMRTEAFRRHPDLVGKGRIGFTAWQERHDVRRGWITPDIPATQLDLIPAEPWRSLAAYYVAKNWARPWPPYADESSAWWDWIPAPVTA